MNIHPRIRRLARTSRIVLASLMGILLVLFVAILLRPVREQALDEVLRIASRSLPGALVVRDANWPSLSRLEFEGVDWRENGVSLALVERVVLDIDLGALTRKDIHVRALVLRGVQADITRISASFKGDPIRFRQTQSDSRHPSPAQGPSPGARRSHSTPFRWTSHTCK